MDHISGLYKKFSFLNQQTFKILRDICLILIILINIIIFVTFDKRIENNRAIDNVENSIKIIITIISILYLLCLIMLIIVWLFVNGSLLYLDFWRNIFKVYKKKLITFSKNSDEDDEAYHSILLNLNKNIYELNKENIIEIISYINSKYLYKNSHPKFEYYFSNIKLILKNSTFSFFISMIFFILIALIKEYYILYSIPMLDIINRFDTLGNVIKAITFNKKQLLLTAFFGLIIVYCYAIFAFLFIDDTFFMTSIEPKGELLCSTLSQCFLTILSLGPRSSGSVGDVILRQSYKEDNRTRYWIRYIFDVSIFFIVNIITMKLIFGIIIDTFGGYLNRVER